MDFDLSEEQTRLKSAARDFATRELAKAATAIDHAGEIPAAIVNGLARAGLLGIGIDGGSGGDRVALVLAVEEIAAACASTARLVSTHVALFCRTLQRFGDDALRSALLAKAARGEVIGTVATIDVENPAATSLVAEKQENGGYVVRGETGPVTLGGVAELFVVFARDASSEGNALVALVVGRDNPGLSIERAEPGFGLRGTRPAMLRFDGSLVAADRVLAESGLVIAKAALEEARLGVAAEAIGVARAAHDKACAHVKVEQQRVVSAGLLGMQVQIADMTVELDAARLLVLRAARLADAGSSSAAESAIGRLFAAEMATRVAHKAMLLHGARGADAALGLERHLRDAHGVELHEERGETQRAVIARSMLEG